MYPFTGKFMIIGPAFNSQLQQADKNSLSGRFPVRIPSADLGVKDKCWRSYFRNNAGKTEFPPESLSHRALNLRGGKS